MGKKWYSYFVVPEEPGPGAASDATTPDPRLVSDVAPEAGRDTTFTTPVTADVDLGHVYEAARITAGMLLVVRSFALAVAISSSRAKRYVTGLNSAPGEP